jgi:hypothetical protein
MKTLTAILIALFSLAWTERADIAGMVYLYEEGLTVSQIIHINDEEVEL